MTALLAATFTLQQEKGRKKQTQNVRHRFCHFIDTLSQFLLSN